MDQLELNTVQELRGYGEAALKITDPKTPEFLSEGYKLTAQVDGGAATRVGTRPVKLVRGTLKGLPAWTFTGEIELPEPRDATQPEHYLARILAKAMGAKSVEIKSLHELSAHVVVYWTPEPASAPPQNEVR